MSIERREQPGTLPASDPDASKEGEGNRADVLAVRSPMGAAGSVRTDRPVDVSEGLPQLQKLALERTEERAATIQGGVARRDDHKRVTCSHCGARVLTRGSGAMWGHDKKGGHECPGSKTWDHS